MPISNTLFTWNDVATAVGAGQMLWSGGAQSGTTAITWSQFTSYVMNDGTNPVGYAAGQCPTWADALARAIVVPPPFSLTITPGTPNKCTCNWSLPTDGSRTAIEITFYASVTYPTGLVVSLANGITTYVRTGLSSGETVSYTLRTVDGTKYSNYVYSPSGTIP